MTNPRKKFNFQHAPSTVMIPLGDNSGIFQKVEYSTIWISVSYRLFQKLEFL